MSTEHTREELQKKTVKKLKEHARKREVSGYSKLNKEDLIELLLNPHRGKSPRGRKSSRGTKAEKSKSKSRSRSGSKSPRGLAAADEEIKERVARSRSPSAERKRNEKGQFVAEGAKKPRKARSARKSPAAKKSAGKKSTRGRKPGSTAKKSPRSKSATGKKSTRGRKVVENKVADFTKESLDKLTIAELKGLAKSKGLVGLSQLKKKEQIVSAILATPHTCSLTYTVEKDGRSHSVLLNAPGVSSTVESGVQGVVVLPVVSGGASPRASPRGEAVNYANLLGGRTPSPVSSSPRTVTLPPVTGSASPIRR